MCVLAVSMMDALARLLDFPLAPIATPLGVASAVLFTTIAIPPPPSRRFMLLVSRPVILCECPIIVLRLQLTLLVPSLNLPVCLTRRNILVDCSTVPAGT